MMPVVLEELVDGTRSKKSGKKVAHEPGISGDGSSILDLSMDNTCAINDNIVSGVKEVRTLRSNAKKKQKKIDSDLEIVEEFSEDSDGLKFNKDPKVPNMELNLNLKTSIDSSEDDLDSDLDQCRVLVVKNGSKQKRVEMVTNKLKNVRKRGKPQSKQVRVQQEKENNKKKWLQLKASLRMVSLENHLKF